MSPLGIKRFVAVLLVLSPWIFIPGLFKDALFIVLGALLFISTLDLRRKTPRHSDHQETESTPRETRDNFPTQSGNVPVRETSIAS